MFAIQTANNATFQSVSNSFVGVMLHYRSTTRKDVTDPVTLETKTVVESKDSAIVFSGEDFMLDRLTEDNIFRAWKEIVNIFWETYSKQIELQKDNAGIRTKLKTATPYEVVITNATRTRIKTIDIASTVWAKIGLVPTTRDLIDRETEKPREWKSRIHKIAKASFDALKFRPQIAEELPKAQTKTAPKALLEAPVEIIDVTGVAV